MVLKVVTGPLGKQGGSAGLAQVVLSGGLVSGWKSVPSL